MVVAPSIILACAPSFLSAHHVPSSVKFYGAPVYNVLNSTHEEGTILM